LNNHQSGYKSVLENFHYHDDAIALSQQTEDELNTFFSGVTNNKSDYSVHNLASYKFAEIPYQKFFSRYLKIILRPKKENLQLFAERVYEAHTEKNQNEWYMKQIKKDLSLVPKYFLKAMSVKEKYKYMCEHYDRLQDIKISLPANNTLYCNPLDLFDLTKFQNLVDQCTDRLDLKSIRLPKSELHTFLEKNKSFFDQRLSQ